MQLRKDFTLGIFHIRINWLIAACTLMTAFSFGSLGLWQLDRAAEKVDTQRALEERLSVSAGPVEDIPVGHLHAANPEMQNLHVSLTGEYLNERTILISAEFFESQIGYGVVTPLRLSSNNQLVLVHRGWTTGILPPNTPPNLRPVEGPVTVTAQVFVPDGKNRVISSTIDAGQWPLRVRTLEIDVMEEILAEPLFPFEVRLTEDQAGTLARHWPAVNVNVNQNLSYSLQWYSLALLVLFASLLASSNLWAILKGTE
ncbi:MAG: surfeit locus 1 family protein [Pseudohongiellaceae bacterium]|jgi:surfeit locus 1 family protein